MQHILIADRTSMLSAVLDALPDGIGVLSLDGSVLFRNAALRRVLNSSNQERPLALRAIRRAFAAVQSLTYDIRSVRLRNHVATARRLEAEASPTGSPVVMVTLRMLRSAIETPAFAQRFALTQRETEVAHLLGRALPNAAIAESLKISPFTARRHTERVLAKIGARSRAEAGVIIAAMEWG